MKNVAKQISRFTKKEIDFLFQTGKAIYKSKEFVILAAPCLLTSSRILLITSRKVGNAPERNLLRRQGRAIFYEEKLFELKRHCVIIFRAPAKNLPFEEFKNILKKYLLRDAGITHQTNTQNLDVQEKKAQDTPTEKLVTPVCKTK